MKTSSSKSLGRFVATFVLSVVAMAFLATPASAQPAATGGGGPGFAPPPAPGGFGNVGQLVFDGTAEFSLVKVTSGNTTFTLRPALDYFIIPNVTIGGVLGISTQSGRFAVTTVSFGARAGYNLNLTDKVSIWPTAGFSYTHIDISDNGGSSSHWAFNIYAPFLFHVVPHFFLGVGPFLDVGLSDGDSNAFGLQSLIGGWF